MTQRTLHDYIKFLKKHHFDKEAYYYETTVTSILKGAGIAEPLDLPTKEVIATLYSIHDALTGIAARLPKTDNVWEVELVNA